MNAREQWIAFSTILRKEIKRFTRIWIQTLLPPVITMALYFVIFGTLIGGRIGEMGGFSYIQFVAPGLIMMAVLTNAYSNVVSSFFSAKFQRSVEEVLVSPTPNYVILLGYTMGGVARGLAVGVLVTIVALLFTSLHMHSWLITFTIVLLTSMLFSLAGFINAIYANTFDDVSIVPTFILTEPYQDNQPFQYDQITGNVTLSYALEQFQKEGELKAATTFLTKLQDKTHG